MTVKQIIDEDFSNYCKPSMLIAMPYCDWKCCKDNNMSTNACQNSPLATQEDIEIDVDDLIQRYIKNPITKTILFGGLEPFDSYDDLLGFISKFREICNDEIVIYTGYYPNEIKDKIKHFFPQKNIIIKFGRYIPNIPSVYDDVLGITLASSNQFAIKIS